MRLEEEAVRPSLQHCQSSVFDVACLIGPQSVLQPGCCLLDALTFHALKE